MEYSVDEGRDWRATLEEWLTKELHCEVFNPNHESNRFFETHHPGIDFRKLKETNIQKYKEVASKFVDIDCKEIAKRSDYVICYWDESAMRGAGTKGELTMARYFGKPVYIVTSMPHQGIPGWVLGCAAHILSSFDELKVFLRT